MTGMGGLRALVRVAGVGLLAALVLPGLAPWAAAILDRRAGGEAARPSLFPIALAALDPFVWRCARNSAAMAVLVAAGSAAVGVSLGMLAGLRRFWGRPALAALAITPMAAGPLLIASGVELVVGGEAAWAWLAARTALGYSTEDLARWSALAWVGLACGAPLVAMATASALEKVEAAAVEAARAVGASRWRAWRDVTWPAIRPDLGRATAAVFALTLAEPAGPLVLGLRRTLAVQMIDATRRLDEPTRAATLAVLAALIAALGHSLIVRLGGRSAGRRRPGIAHPSPSAGRRGGSIAVLILGAWAAFALGPAVLVLARAHGESRDPAWPIRGWMADPESWAWLANAATTAGLAVGLDLLALWALGRRGPGRVARALAVVPPLALGVGALAIPWLIEAVAGAAGDGPGRPLRALALELAPGRAPGFLLILALAASRLPMLALAADLARSRSRPVLEEAAMALGLSPRRARRAGDPRWLGIVPGRSALLALILAATNLAPALLLTPTPERRTPAPAALGLVLRSGATDPRAARLLAALFSANLVGLTLASRGRDGRIGEWFRG